MSQTLAESETMLNGDATTTKAFVQESGGGTSARDPNANKSNFLWPHILPRPSKNPNQICLAATTVVCCTGMVAMAIAMVLLLRPGLFLNQAHFKKQKLRNRLLVLVVSSLYHTGSFSNSYSCRSFFKTHGLLLLQT